jgi:hypothetical protein
MLLFSAFIESIPFTFARDLAIDPISLVEVGRISAKLLIQLTIQLLQQIKQKFVIFDY